MRGDIKEGNMSEKKRLDNVTYTELATRLGVQIHRKKEHIST